MFSLCVMDLMDGSKCLDDCSNNEGKCSFKITLFKYAGA